MRGNHAYAVSDFIDEFARYEIREYLNAEADGGQQRERLKGSPEFRFESDIEERDIVDDERLYHVSRITSENGVLVGEFSGWHFISSGNSFWCL